MSCMQRVNQMIDLVRMDGWVSGWDPQALRMVVHKLRSPKVRSNLPASLAS